MPSAAANVRSSPGVSTPVQETTTSKSTASGPRPACFKQRRMALAARACASSTYTRLRASVPGLASRKAGSASTLWRCAMAERAKIRPARLLASPWPGKSIWWMACWR
jgi:hypothetical protein